MPAEGSVIMKQFIRVLFWIAIACAAAVSVRRAVQIYQTKYAPRYLKGNAG